jgi:predicted outer membrane repeat protein
MKKFSFIIFIILSIFSFANLAFANDYYVDAVNGKDTNSGLYADDAWKTITGALSKVPDISVNPAIIHVASGIYDLALGETFPLIMKNAVQLIGEDKDTTIIDATGSGTSVILCDSITNVEIEGLTIKGGAGIVTNFFSNYNLPCGGGIYCLSSDLKIQNCLITENTAKDGAGGGIYSDSSSLEINNCVINNNTSFYGGGLSIGSKSPLSTIIRNTIIEDNSAVRGVVDKNPNGGGISIGGDNFLSMNNCIIRRNTAIWGGGISSYSSWFKIENTVFEANNAHGGAGFCIGYIEHDDAQIIDCKFLNNQSKGTGGAIYLDSSNPIIYKCTIENNSTGNEGGGIGGNSGSSPNIIDCLINNNKAHLGGGICLFGASFKIINSLITNNIAENKDGEIGKGGGFYNDACNQPQIIQTAITGNIADKGSGVFSKLDGFKPPILINCIVWGNGSEPIIGPATISYSDVEGCFEGDHNINKDPLFVAGPWGDYYLSHKVTGQEYDSPCLNKGTDNDLLLDYVYLEEYSNRIDGISDFDGIYDMGKYYPLNFGFDLKLIPDQYNFKSGDKVKLTCDIQTAPYKGNIKIDLYILMLSSIKYQFFSYPLWIVGSYPALENFPVPGNLSFNDVILVDTTIPSESPSMPGSGLYGFAMYALSPVTQKLISNFPLVIFEVE